MHFGQWLKREIENRMVPHTEFARQMGVNPATLFRWLRKRRPRMHAYNVVRIANALGISREEVEQVLEDEPAATAAA
jgi:plasmid maintenance system antidote protein VapI